MKRKTKILLFAAMFLQISVAVAQTAPPSGSKKKGAAVASKDKSGRLQSDRLREMEEDIVSLKEKVYKTKVRLNLLRERILSNVIAEAWTVITHKNEMSSAFRLDHVLYYLDGKKLFYKQNHDAFLDKHRTIEVFRGNVVPGNHSLSVELIYRGSGEVFSYLKGYRFKITSKYTFYASRGRIVKLDVIGYEKGGITYSLEDKPAIQFKASQLPFNKENISRLTSGKK